MQSAVCHHVRNGTILNLMDTDAMNKKVMDVYCVAQLQFLLKNVEGELLGVPNTCSWFAVFVQQLTATRMMIWVAFIIVHLSPVSWLISLIEFIVEEK